MENVKIIITHRHMDAMGHEACQQVIDSLSQAYEHLDMECAAQRKLARRAHRFGILASVVAAIFIALSGVLPLMVSR